MFFICCAEQSTQGALDPRAGRVDVVMHEIKFNPHEIVQHLEDLKYKKFTRVRNRKCIDRIVDTYKRFAGGVFPIGIQKLEIDRDELIVPDVDEKAEEFLEFENELYGKQRELKKVNKRKRKKIVSNQEMFDEFQAKSNKIAKIKHEANAWTEEDNTAANEVSTTSKKPKKLKKKKELKEDQTKTSTPNIFVDNGTPVSEKRVKIAKPTKTPTPTVIVDKGTSVSEKRVKIAKPSKSSTPTVILDNGTPLSEKRVKIALKMNRSQEVNEYMRQLKQSPHPYDSAKKPSKGVLKPNLAPSPINPFYKRLIGIE